MGLGRVRTTAAPMTPAHGTRACYLHGCHCDPCKAAEAAYRQQLRHDHRAGIQRLGSVVSPVEAQRHIRQLKAEHLTARQIAQQLGLVHHAPRLHPDGITVRKLLRIRRLRRLHLAESTALARAARGAHTAP